MNKSLEMSWEKLQNEIFNSDEIEASKMRIAPIISEFRQEAKHNFLKDLALKTAKVAII